jgi:hypothetical protein
MDSMGDILARKEFDEPDEVKLIKQFVRDNYNESVSISVSKDGFVVYVDSASLANALHLRLPDLRKIIGPTKRLSFRIN